MFVSEVLIVPFTSLGDRAESLLIKPTSFHTKILSMSTTVRIDKQHSMGTCSVELERKIL